MQYASQQASHSPQLTEHTQQAVNHASQPERCTPKQASHTYQPQQVSAMHSLSTSNMPTRSASMRYPSNVSDVQTNPVGYLPGGSYTTEHIGRERSSSHNTVDTSVETQSRSRSYTVHDTTGSNGEYCI